MSVRPVGRLVMHHLLGRHVQRRAGDGPFLREMNRLSSLQGFDQAEVEQLGDVIMAAAIGRHQVGRLDVAVNQSRFVRLAERFARLAEQIDHARGRHRAEPLDQGRPG